METKITFKKKTNTYVSILLNGKEVGHIFSEMKDGLLPYPHDKSKEYCKNSVQLCGFDRCSEVWACGIFNGRKDLVVNFINYSEDFNQQELQRYKKYVQEFIDQELPMDELKSFQDWMFHMGYPSIAELKMKKKIAKIR